MTAEIAIMNANAIALAADSAVTINMVTVDGSVSQKIFTSANKLFELSMIHPVGVMIYQNSSFMGIPWETIIKVYRKELGDEKRDTLKEYADSFIEFLTGKKTERELFPNEIQENRMYEEIRSYFDYVKTKILTETESRISKRKKITSKNVEDVVAETIKEQYEIWQDTENIPSIPESFNQEILERYSKEIDEIMKEIFENLPISDDATIKLKEISSSLFSKYPEEMQTNDYSGIIIAGFGDKEYFPSIESYRFDSVVMGKIKYKEILSKKINFTGLSGFISPFAQREMVDTFMSGVDPSYRKTEMKYIKGIFKNYTSLIVEKLEKYDADEKNELAKILNSVNATIISEFDKRMNDYILGDYIQPITSMISELPIDELALMAESLVNLTSLKRKISNDAETVAGPIDVAVISKGDGFIWIKRKYYFNQGINS